MKKIIILVAVSVIAVGCLPIPSKDISDNKLKETREYIDLAGRKININKEVNRIVLLRSKDIYSLAVLLGDELPQKLIAWGPDLQTDDTEAYNRFTDKYPSLKALPLTGSIYNDALSIEQLIALKPDLIIADKFIIEREYRYVEKLNESALPVVYLDGSNDPFTGSQRGISLLGQILNKEKKAGEITSYVNQQLNNILSVIDSAKLPERSVYLEAGSSGPQKFAQTYGSSGFPKTYTSWGRILHRLRVNNIADGIASEMGSINPELILRANPDVIIITGQNWNTINRSMRLGYEITAEESHELLSGFIARPGWSSLDAVKEGRVFSVFHNTAAIVCFASIQALAKYIYPEYFKNIDPERNLKTFYEKFMPIEYSGVWMTGI